MESGGESLPEYGILRTYMDYGYGTDKTFLFFLVNNRNEFHYRIVKYSDVRKSIDKRIPKSKMHKL